MYRKERKLPTLLGILLIMLGIGTTAYLDKTMHSTTSQASSASIPQEVHFTNITDSSFSVSWLTDKPDKGSVVIRNGHSQIFFDDLDTDNIQRARTAHYVTVRNLNEDTVYSVKVIAGDAKCTNPSSCQVFSQKTAPKLPQSVNIPPVNGKIVTPDNQTVNAALVYMLVDKSLPLSGRTDSSGLWVVSFTNLLSVNLLNRPQLADTDLIQIIIKLMPNQETTAVVDVKSIRQNPTLPVMIMGNSYNLINLISKKDILANLSNQNLKTLGIQAQPTKKPMISLPTRQKIDILFPAFDSDTTWDSRPRFRGIGIKGQELLITINSTPQVGKVQIGADGSWSWRPPQALSPGIHHLSIQGYDENGNLITVNRKFIVFKSGQQVLGEATPSASLTPAASPSATITPSPRPPSPTAILTSTPAPLATSIPTSPPSPPPRSGNQSATFILLGSAVGLFLLGTKFLLFP